MDFTFTEEQETIAKVARQLFEHRVTPEHLTELEARRRARYDAALWRELATADLLGIALPEKVGGSGHGFVELALLLAEVGWSVAPVPVYATLLLGADTIARYGDDDQQQRYLPDVVDGSRLLTAGLTEPGRSDPTEPATTAQRDGERLATRRSQGAGSGGPDRTTRCVIAATDSTTVTSVLFLLDANAAGVDIRPAATTNGEPHADVILDGAVVSGDDRLPGNGKEMVESLYAARTRRAVRDPARRDRTRAAHRRLVHHRTRAVRQADRQLPGRAAADGRCVHRRRGDPVDHVAGRLAARPGSTARAGGRASRSSGRPRQALASRRPLNRCTGESASTPPIRCSATSCGPSTTS